MHLYLPTLLDYVIEANLADWRREAAMQSTLEAAAQAARPAQPARPRPRIGLPANPFRRYARARAPQSGH